VRRIKVKNIIRSCLEILLYLLLTIAVFIYPTELSYNELMAAGLNWGGMAAIMEGLLYLIKKMVNNNIDLKVNKKILMNIILRLFKYIMGANMLLMFYYFNKNYSNPLVYICSLLVVGLLIDSIINIVIKIIKKVKEAVNYIRKAVKKD